MSRLGQNLTSRELDEMVAVKGLLFIDASIFAPFQFLNINDVKFNIFSLILESISRLFNSLEPELSIGLEQRWEDFI